MISLLKNLLFYKHRVISWSSFNFLLVKLVSSLPKHHHSPKILNEKDRLSEAIAQLRIGETVARKMSSSSLLVQRLNKLVLFI